jgi:DNA-directed RNA polymerase specialized sigma24 family protein
LFEVEGLSAQEIAEATGATLGTVYRRLHEARAAFGEGYAPGAKGGAT